MKRFSERAGYTKPKEIQHEGVDEDIRNRVWNLLNTIDRVTLENLVTNIWSQYYKRPIDTVPSYQRNRYSMVADISFLKTELLGLIWFELFDLLEYIASKLGASFCDYCNVIFEDECLAYRFVNGCITEITSKNEILEIELASNSSIEEVNLHINTALGHYSRKQNPDYRNSIKESISAVECICRKITGESTLGPSIKKLESKGLELNSQFKKGLENIYNYTNGEQGIRHSIMDNTDIRSEDAKFMLVICSAFVNYIKEKDIKLKLLKD